MTDLVRVDRASVQYAIDYMAEDLVCDHGVNICFCEARAVVHALKLALDGQKVCGACGGEGFDWVGDTDVVDKCETCDSKGSVPL